MKQVLALAASAGFLFWGCAPRPEAQGGGFDTSINLQNTPAANESGLRYSPQRRALGTQGIPGKSPNQVVPDEDTSNDDNPELMLPRHKNEMLTI